MPKKDLNQTAANIMRLTTDQSTPEPPVKNPAAVALGRLGGLRGGAARAKALSKEERSAIAREAAKTRWSKKRTSSS